MKHNKLLYSLFFVFLCGVSCKKDPKENMILHGIYMPQGPLQLNGDPIMYTRNGALTDTNIITEFVSRKAGSNAYKLSATDLIASSHPFTLNFLDSGLVNYTFDNGFGGVFRINARISHQSVNDITITHADSVFTTYQHTYGCARLSRIVTGFGNISTCRAFSGFSECMYLPYFKLTMESGQVYQNLITYLVTNTTPTLSFPGGPPAFNVCYSMENLTPDNFDPSVYTQLLQGDTIVIQRKKAKFVKQ